MTMVRSSLAPDGGKRLRRAPRPRRAPKEDAARPPREPGMRPAVGAAQPSARARARRLKARSTPLQQLDRDVLRAADEGDAHAGAGLPRLHGELDALRLQLRRRLVQPLHDQPEVVEALV